MSSLRRLVTAGIVGMLGTVGTTSCGSGETAPNATVTGLEAPEVIVAGADLEVVVSGSGDGLVRLDVVDAFATSTFELTLVDGTAALNVPDRLTTLSGVVRFRALGAESSSQLTSTKILPIEGASRIDVHVGPRSVVADGTDRTMSVAIATDRFGNPVAEDSSIEFTTVDDDGSIAVAATAPVENGVAAHLLSTDTVAGPVDVFATADSSIASRRVGYDEVPGIAATVAIASPVLGTQWRADGRTLIAVTSAPITDRFGNLLPDGHLVRLAVEGPEGSGRLTAKTINGIADFEVVAPSRPGPIRLALSVDGVASDPVEFDTLPAVSRLPVSISSGGDGIVVTVGPVLDAAGAVVSDGTAVTVALGDQRGQAELVAGTATITLDAAATSGESLAAEVLGVVERLELP